MNIDPQQFTTTCKQILHSVEQSIAVACRAQLQHDELARPHKGNKPTLMFAVWGKDAQGFWHRGYCCYSIVHDPYKILSQEVPFQVRFHYFHNRKETSSGRFNARVRETLVALDGKRGFLYEEHHKTYHIYRAYNNPAVTPQWQKDAGEDLGWLISQTYPAFERMLGSPATP